MKGLRGILALGIATLFGQTLSTEEGFLLPTRDTVYILVVFAEVDYSACGEDPHVKQYGFNWPVGLGGEAQVPADADSLLDAWCSASETPKGIITRIYAEASFGQFVVLGDYLPEVVRVPCKALPARGTQSLYEEVALVARHWPAGLTHTARGLPLSYFDRWQLLPQRAGRPKLRAPVGDPSYKPRLDVLFIVWRNLAYRLDARPPFPCNYGFGLWICDYREAVGPFTGGIETASSYTTCHTAKGGSVGFLAEFFHGLYGGNHWHTAGGAGLHTFPFLPVCRGLSVQGGRPIYAVGYDRWLMGWKASHKTYLLSALDENGREVPTDLQQPSAPLVQRFWLRDFLTTGDVIRIRLPYTEKGGPAAKNQYLWLENRRFLATESWGLPGMPCSDTLPAGKVGFPGLYAYIQVGKDEKTGPDIYTANPAHPNGLGSWLFSLSAEGNYDFYLRHTPHGWAIDKAYSLPNPFTGMNDLYVAHDADTNGQVTPAEATGLGWVEWKGDSACISAASAGDSEDPFTLYGYTTLSLETNPAPVPVYTLLSAEGYRSATRQQPAPYDNRTIWLNGLCIQLLREREDGALLVEIRWDVFTVRRAVRWCGRIHLSPNPFSAEAPALLIKGTVLLDRSLSPTYGVAQAYDSTEKRFWYSDTTLLIVEKGATLHIAKGGKLILRRGSRLVIESGAQVTGKGSLWLEAGSQLELAPGASLTVTVRERKKPYPLFLEGR